MMQLPLRILFGIAGLFLAPLGFAGVFLPLLPGTPLLILAAACFARSSPHLEHRLLGAAWCGPAIRAWRERGAITTRVKLIALPVMAFSGVAAALSDAPMIGKFIAYFVLAGTALFVLSRPSV